MDLEMVGVCNLRLMIFSVSVVTNRTHDIGVIFGIGNVPPLFHCFDEYSLRYCLLYI